jgi:hypothetical protein
MTTDNDDLVMTGDWKLTYGHTVGLVTDGTTVGHWVPVTSLHTHVVRFGDGMTPSTVPSGVSSTLYKGSYLQGGDAHSPLSEEPEAVWAQTYYLGRGVVVVELIDRADQYIALLTGHHQFYQGDPARVEIVGGWVDVGGVPPPANTNSGRGNFVMVKI